MREGMFDDLEGDELMAALGNLAAIVRSEMQKLQETIVFLEKQRDFYESSCIEKDNLLRELGIYNSSQLSVGQISDIQRRLENVQ